MMMINEIITVKCDTVAYYKST